MNDSDIPALVEHWAAHPNCWWMQRGADAIRKGWFRCIHGRNDREVYLVRMWLSTPVKILDGDDEIFDSGESVLLHYFCRGDDDKALHDHPWDFTTSIINGGYEEHLPPSSWAGLSDWPRSLVSGPPYDENIVKRLRGETIRHEAHDLHFVGHVEPNTVTLVTTSAKKRSWGFYPPGEPWMPWRQYLASLKGKG